MPAIRCPTGSFDAGLEDVGLEDYDRPTCLSNLKLEHYFNLRALFNR